MRLVYLVFVLIIFISCEKSNTKYYPNGNIWKQYYLKDSLLTSEYKEYFPNGNIAVKKQYYKGIAIDSSIYYSDLYPNKIDVIEYHIGDTIRIVVFDEENNISQEGLSINKQRIGKWHIYEKAKLMAIQEYLIINDQEYLNQNWHIHNLDTVYDGSYFFQIISNEYYKLNEDFKAFAILNVEWFKDLDSEVKLTLAADESKIDFNEDFSNEDIVVKETFFNLSKDSINSRWIDISGNEKHVVAFVKKLNSFHNQRIRGYITEYYEYLEKDSVLREERRYYFDMPVEIGN